MKTNGMLSLLLRGNQLKRVPRTGWVMRGVPDAESVSDHAFGVAFTALALAEAAEQPVDTGKLLAMALLHDLPEAVLGDIPAPAARRLEGQAKSAAERKVMHDLLDDGPLGGVWREWWDDHEELTSIEAKLVHDADRLDMLIQAYVYEQTTGNRWLEEFWAETTGASFECQVSRALFGALSQARSGAARDRTAASDAVGSEAPSRREGDAA